MAGLKEEAVQSSGGVKIFVRSWSPSGSPRAVVVICHGVNSHGGQYIWSGEQLSADGYAVYALDLRGRGKSEGERFYVEDINDYAADVGAVIKLAKLRNPGLPVFLLGHSAGGVTSCYYTLDHQNELAGLICESFAFKVPAPDFALAILKGVSKIAPRLPVLTLHNKDFTRDPKALAALNSDPLIANEKQPAMTVAALVRGTERLKKEFPRITLPVFIMHGTADKATVPAGSQFFYDTAGSKDKTLKLYEGHVHDLLSDIGKEGVMADIKAWIAKRLPGA
jgi:acylglycerol lipase